MWLPANFRTVGPAAASIEQLDAALGEVAKSLPKSVTQANPELLPAIDTFIKLTSAATTPPGGGTTPTIDNFFDITYRVNTQDIGPQGSRTRDAIKMTVRQLSPEGEVQATSDYFLKFKTAGTSPGGATEQPAAYIKFGPRAPEGRPAADYFLKIQNASLEPAPTTPAAPAAPTTWTPSTTMAASRSTCTSSACLAARP